MSTSNLACLKINYHCRSKLQWGVLLWTKARQAYLSTASYRVVLGHHCQISVTVRRLAAGRKKWRVNSKSLAFIGRWGSWLCQVHELYEHTVDISLAAAVQDERQRGALKIAGRSQRWPEIGRFYSSSPVMSPRISASALFSSCAQQCCKRSDTYHTLRASKLSHSRLLFRTCSSLRRRKTPPCIFSKAHWYGVVCIS